MRKRTRKSAKTDLQSLESGWRNKKTACSHKRLFCVPSHRLELWTFQFSAECFQLADLGPVQRVKMSRFD